jgi:hypothetical protein
VRPSETLNEEFDGTYFTEIEYEFNAIFILKA